MRQDSQALLKQAKIFIEVGKYPEALVLFEQVVELQPECFSAWYWRGYTLSNLKQIEEAIDSYNQAIAIKPNYLVALFEKGNTLYELRYYEEAIASWRQALEISPESEFEAQLINRIIPLQIAKVLHNNLKQYEQVISLYDRLIQGSENLTEAWVNRGLALYQLNRYQEAIASCNQALRINNRDAQAWTIKGLAFYRENHHLAAITSLENAARINPNELAIAGLIIAVKSSATLKKRQLTAKHQPVKAENNSHWIKQNMSVLQGGIIAAKKAFRKNNKPESSLIVLKNESEDS